MHGNFEALKQNLALVPQKDVLHDTLAVGQALNYTARLRLPPDTSGKEVRGCIDEILQTVQLSHRKSRRNSRPAATRALVSRG